MGTIFLQYMSNAINFVCLFDLCPHVYSILVRDYAALGSLVILRQHGHITRRITSNKKMIAIKRDGMRK